MALKLIPSKINKHYNNCLRNVNSMTLQWSRDAIQFFLWIRIRLFIFLIDLDHTVDPDRKVLR